MLCQFCQCKIREGDTDQVCGNYLCYRAIKGSAVAAQDRLNQLRLEIRESVMYEWPQYWPRSLDIQFYEKIIKSGEEMGGKNAETQKRFTDLMNRKGK